MLFLIIILAVFFSYLVDLVFVLSVLILLSFLHVCTPDKFYAIWPFSLFSIFLRSLADIIIEAEHIFLSIAHLRFTLLFARSCFQEYLYPSII